jgi:hypothetical protein
MRPQNRPFTVETRKSRKAGPQRGLDLGWAGVEPTTVTDLPRSPSLAAADRLFRDMTDPADPRRLGKSVQAEALLVTPHAPVGLGVAANRILPDLTRRNDLRAAGDDETPMASRTRGPRRTGKRSSGNETPQDRKTGIKPPAKRAIAAMATSADQEPDAQAPVERSLSVAALDRETSGPVNPMTPSRSKPARKPSPREIRRAAACGMKIDSGAYGNPSRKRRRRVD